MYAPHSPFDLWLLRGGGGFFSLLSPGSFAGLVFFIKILIFVQFVCLRFPLPARFSTPGLQETRARVSLLQPQRWGRKTLPSSPCCAKTEILEKVIPYLVIGGRSAAEGSNHHPPEQHVATTRLALF